MAYYVNSNPSGLFKAVEFSPQAQGNTTFFYAAPKQMEALRAFVRQDLGQTIVAETQMQGQHVLITQGDKLQTEIEDVLKAHADRLTPKKKSSQFDIWKLRGGLNMVGQGLQLGSGYLTQGGLDAPKLMFAFSNILASCINITFGAQTSEDTHQLVELEKKFHDKIGLSAGAPLPSPAQPSTQDQISNTKHPIHNFIAHHSVRFGEIGLRYFGSVALAFPLSRLGQAARAFKTGGFSEAFRLAKNPNNTNFYAGSIYLVGKTLGLFSKVPDPYNPNPPTTLDILREKVFFRLSSVIETGAASTLAYGSFKKGEIVFSGKKYHDYLGGAGGIFLASALTSRIFAKFGVREVNMDKLQSYLTDCLAQVPQDKLNQVIAETAAGVKDHFKDNAPTFGQLYTQLTQGLAKHHHITVNTIPDAFTELAPAPPYPKRPIAEPANSYADQLSQNTADNKRQHIR